jgi:hypothetical protein
VGNEILHFLCYNEAMRLIPALFAFCLFSASAAGAVDIAALGKPLDNDMTPMRDRYVYFNQEANAKIVPVDRALLTSLEVEEWLRQRVADALTLTGAQYDQKTIATQRYFTPEGYAYYMSSLEAASLPSLLKEKGYNLSAIVIQKPEITGQGLRDITPADAPANTPRQMQYVWLAKVPATLSYEIGDQVNSYPAVIEVELVRIPLRDDGAQVAMNAWRFGSTEKAKIEEEPLVRGKKQRHTGSRFAF